jgi:hypothetical protein
MAGWKDPTCPFAVLACLSSLKVVAGSPIGEFMRRSQRDVMYFTMRFDEWERRWDE